MASESLNNLRDDCLA